MEGMGRRCVLGDHFFCDDKICLDRSNFLLGWFEEFCGTHALVDRLAFDHFLEKDRAATFLSSRDGGR